MDPQPRGPDWMQITPKAGSLFHAYSHFGSERLTGALLDRLTHHVHILEMNGESFRLATSKKAQRRTGQATNATPKTTREGDANPKL